MKYKQPILNIMLIGLIILEHLFLYVVYNKHLLSQGKNAIALFLSSVLFGIVIIYKFYNVTTQEVILPPVKNKAISYPIILLAAVGLVILGVKNYYYFDTHGIDCKNSDIIPLIQVMCKRLIHGQFVYDIVNDFGYPLRATYLPVHWMPFTIAELLRIDYRWVAFAVWCIAGIWICMRSIKVSSPALRVIIPLMIPVSYYILQQKAPGILEMTVEPLIAAYYMMLIIGLNKQNGIVQGLIISCCLLSRYYIVLWLPLYFFILFVTNNRKQLYTAIATVFVVTVLLYVIPFMSKDWGLFYNGYKYYDRAAFFEWTHLNGEGNPIQLFSGTGYAYHFYTRFPKMDIMSRIKLLQETQLVCSVLITVLMGAWFWFNKNKINHKIFLLSSFKIYLAVFLFLVQVPYVYLMCVGNFVSIAIFCEQARYKIAA